MPAQPERPGEQPRALGGSGATAMNAPTLHVVRDARTAAAHAPTRLEGRPRPEAVAASPERLRSVVLLGLFGTGNLGNEASLLAMLRQLRRKFPDANISVACGNPARVSQDRSEERRVGKAGGSR